MLGSTSEGGGGGGGGEACRASGQGSLLLAMQE